MVLQRQYCYCDVVWMSGERCAVNHSITCIPASPRAYALEQHFDTALNAKEFGMFHTTGAGRLIEGEDGESGWNYPTIRGRLPWPAKFLGVESYMPVCSSKLPLRKPARFFSGGLQEPEAALD
ncbi:MAG: hypothetical protein JO356_17965 [Acidobacteria bacterium]|nr:hypothetical protein [Acidobacteriota bacterium]